MQPGHHRRWHDGRPQCRAHLHREGGTLIRELARHIRDERIALHTGVSYRHLLVVKGMEFDVRTYPPHDHIGKPVEKLLPRGKGADLLIQLMNQSQQVFAGHDVNKVRQDLGENQVSSIWLWGQGKQARLDSFRKRHIRAQGRPSPPWTSSAGWPAWSSST